LAQTIISEHGGVIPDDPETLRQLSGLGKYSAAAIAAFAFNSPQVFIETNIRTVFIHHFFKDRQSVDDGELLPYIEKTLDRRDPRKWYYALMDYGVVLKKTLGNAASRSSHYKRQSAFKGSNRQLRGKMLKLLLASPKGLTAASIAKTLEADEAAIRANLMRFAAEELIKRSGRCYCIAQD
jgi:A/G-specific adenine glycosylase